jgi:hypothetical protein
MRNVFGRVGDRAAIDVIDHRDDEDQQENDVAKAVVRRRWRQSGVLSSSVVPSWHA